MKQTAERDLKVRYFEKEDGKNIWTVESHMVEEEHDIMVILDIDMEQMVIINAEVKFNRYPLADCKLVETVASKLIGIHIDRSFSQNVMKITMGPAGCPNVMTLLTISVPGIIYYYYPYKIKTGEITKEQFYDKLRGTERNACLAHTMLFTAESNHTA